MVPQQQQRCQDNNIFVQIFPWKKINARFQSNTTFVILFMYFCFVYFQSGYSIIPIVVKKANKNNSSKISSRCQSSFNTVFAGFYVQKRYDGKSHQRILAVVNIGWNPASHTASIKFSFQTSEEDSVLLAEFNSRKKRIKTVCENYGAYTTK